MNVELKYTCASEEDGDSLSEAPHSAHSGGTAGERERQYCSSVLHLFSSWTKIKNNILILILKYSIQE